jgi:hypothetical protein
MTYVMRLLFVFRKWRDKWCYDSEFVSLVNFTEILQVHLTGLLHDYPHNLNWFVTIEMPPGNQDK